MGRTSSHPRNPQITHFSAPLFSQTCAPPRPQPLSIDIHPQNTGYSRMAHSDTSVPPFQLLTFDFQLVLLTPFAATPTENHAIPEKHAPASPSDVTLTDTLSAKSFTCSLTKNSGGLGGAFSSWRNIARRNVTPYSKDSTAMKRIYLDHNATTSVDAAVLDAMLPFFAGDFGNASSIHTFGQRARAAVETAREQVAALINARAQEIIFTSGGTESDNHAIFGIVAASLASPSTTQPHIITTSIEHEAVLNACQALEKQGVAVTYLAVNRHGLINLGELQKAIRPETVLITVMHANNELGTVQPLAEIGKIAAGARYLLPYGCRAISGKNSRRCEGSAARPAGSLWTQAVCAKRGRCDVHKRRHTSEATSLWRASPAWIPTRHGKCSGNCWTRKSRRIGANFAGSGCFTDLGAARQVGKWIDGARS